MKNNLLTPLIEETKEVNEMSETSYVYNLIDVIFELLIDSELENQESEK